MAPVTGISDKGSIGMVKSGGVHPGKINRGSEQGINRRRDVTPDQKQRIRELYEATGNGHKVARQMGLASTTIYNHLGLQKSTHPAWTDDEIQVLVDGYLEKKSAEDIAKIVGRSPRAVKIKMCRYRKQIKNDPKKRRALSAITMVLRAVRKADIFRELEP